MSDGDDAALPPGKCVSDDRRGGLRGVSMDPRAGVQVPSDLDLDRLACFLPALRGTGLGKRLPSRTPPVSVIIQMPWIG